MKFTPSYKGSEAVCQGFKTLSEKLEVEEENQGQAPLKLKSITKALEDISIDYHIEGGPNPDFDKHMATE